VKSEEPCETIDELRRYNLRITQPRDGYRFSIDPLLLAEFAVVQGGGRVADLGSGSGILPLILARRDKGVTAVGIEFQEAMAKLARRNVDLNGLGERVTILREDVLNLRQSFPVSTFDLVVANPPYRQRGRGRVSPKEGRDLARHESTATLTDFLAAAKYLVKPAGRICLIYLAERLADFLAAADRLKLSPLRLRMVHGTASAAARMFLIELAKGRKGELSILPPMIVYEEDGGYTRELVEVLGNELGTSL